MRENHITSLIKCTLPVLGQEITIWNEEVNNPLHCNTGECNIPSFLPSFSVHHVPVHGCLQKVTKGTPEKTNIFTLTRVWMTLKLTHSCTRLTTSGFYSDVMQLASATFPWCSSIRIGSKNKKNKCGTAALVVTRHLKVSYMCQKEFLQTHTYINITASSQFTNPPTSIHPSWPCSSISLMHFAVTIMIWW